MSQHKKYWSAIAKAYDSDVNEIGDQSQQLFINPIVEKLLGDLQGKIVLDAGCGNGYWTRKIAEKASHVVGIDFTNELIEKAKTRGIPANVEFLVEDLAQIKFPDETFDTVLLNMVVLDLENLGLVMRRISEVIKNGGEVIASTIHPCFENPPYTQSVIDEKGKKIGRTISHYFKTGLIEDQTNRYQHWHHTLSDYINVFADNQLFIEKMIETNEADVLEDIDTAHFPYFLIMKLKKINRG
ncbi:methyltransferase domain-containing protein [Candidatus Dojkabacteria bacterium]|nr:methyltransferase domain-containing protein [Candidatus Dojkabacteria bacterium]